MSFTALKRQPAEQMAAEALKKSIVGGDLKPGERLTEMVLADQFAVSRGTVRAALHQLSSDGLVVLTPYTGWSVATICQRDVWEIYTLRGGLEALAARLAAELLDGGGRRKLTQARDRFFAACAKPDVAVAVEHDFALHRCIVELSGNGRLLAQYTLIEQQVRFFINSTYGAKPNISTAIAHHAPIVDAILAGKARTAACHSEQHILSEGERLMALMKSDAN